MSFELRGGRELLGRVGEGKIRVSLNPFSSPSALSTANPITTFNTEPPMGKSRMNNLANKTSGIDRLWGLSLVGSPIFLYPNKSFLIRDKWQQPNLQKGTKNRLDLIKNYYMRL